MEKPKVKPQVQIKWYLDSDRESVSVDDGTYRSYEWLLGFYEFSLLRKRDERFVF